MLRDVGVVCRMWVLFTVFSLLGLGCTSSDEQPEQPAPKQVLSATQQPAPTVSEPLPTPGAQPLLKPGTAPKEDATSFIPWQALSKALPTEIPGWELDGEIEGESANMMGISISRAGCKLVNDKKGMTARVQIVDTSMNPMLAMPFNMARNMQIDSSKERMGPIDFGIYPGTQKYDKKRGQAQITMLVHNRILVTVEVNQADSEAPAVTVAKQVNLKILAELAGG
jgi:hypothetical protein